MKFTLIFVIFTLTVIVNSNLLVAVTRPVILSIGTLFAALNHDASDSKFTEWRSNMSFVEIDGEKIDTSKVIKTEKELQKKWGERKESREVLIKRFEDWIRAGNSMDSEEDVMRAVRNP